MPELESAAARELSRNTRCAASALASVEVLRAAQRAPDSHLAVERARRVLAGVVRLPLSDEILRSAGALQPPGLRSLDAIHLASALSLGEELHAMVVYDRALAAAARAYGIRVLAP